MHHQHVAPVQVAEQVLGPPLQPLDPRAGQPLDEALGKRKTQVGPPLLDAAQPGALQHRLQAAADGFDFGKLGHGGLSPARGLPLASLGAVPGL